MSVLGLAMVRDEADIIETTIRHTLRHVDRILILDNRSVDGTREILDRLAEETGRVDVIDDPEVGYYQSRKMTELAVRAYELGATWAVPFDADELWTAGGGRIGTLLESLTDDADVDVVEADFYHYVHTPTDPADVNPVRSMVWRETTSAIPKVAVRIRPGVRIIQGNHSASYFGTPAAVAAFRFVVHHYPNRSFEQFIRKAVQGAEAYQATTGLPEQYGFHWRDVADLWHTDPAAAHDLYRTMTWREDPEADPTLIYDPVVL